MQLRVRFTAVTLTALVAGVGCARSPAPAPAPAHPAIAASARPPLRVWSIPWQVAPRRIEAPSRDGRFVLMDSDGLVIFRLAEPAGPLVRLDEFVSGNVVDTEWAPDSRRLAVLSVPKDTADWEVLVVDLEDNAIASRFRVENPPRNRAELHFIGGTDRLGIVGERTLSVHDSQNGARVAEVVLAGVDPSFSPLAPLVALRASSPEKPLVVFDARDGRVLDSIRLEAVSSFEWSQTSVALAAHGETELAIWRPAQKTLRIATNAALARQRPVWGADGRTIALGVSRVQCQNCVRPSAELPLVFDTFTGAPARLADFHTETPEWTVTSSGARLAADDRARPRRRPLPGTSEFVRTYSAEWTSERSALLFFWEGSRLEVDVETGRVLRELPERAHGDELGLPDRLECGGEHYRVVRASDGARLGDLPFPCSKSRPVRVGRYFAGQIGDSNVIVDAQGRRVADVPASVIAAQSDPLGASLVLLGQGELCARFDFASKKLVSMPRVESRAGIHSGKCISGAWGIGRLQRDDFEKFVVYVWRPDKQQFVTPEGGESSRPTPYCTTKLEESPDALICLDPRRVRVLLSDGRQESQALSAPALAVAWTNDKKKLALVDDRGKLLVLSSKGEKPTTLQLAKVPAGTAGIYLSWRADGHALLAHPTSGLGVRRDQAFIVTFDGPKPAAHTLPGDRVLRVRFAASGQKVLVEAVNGLGLSAEQHSFVYDVRDHSFLDVGASSVPPELSPDDRTLFHTLGTTQVIRDGVRIAGGQYVTTERGHVLFENEAGKLELWSHAGERIGTLPPGTRRIPYLSPSKRLGIIVADEVTQLVRIGASTALTLRLTRPGSRTLSLIQSPAGWFSGEPEAFESLRFARGENLFDAEPLTGKDVVSEQLRPQFLADYLAGRAVPLVKPTGLVNDGR